MAATGFTKGKILKSSMWSTRSNLSVPHPADRGGFGKTLGANEIHPSGNARLEKSGHVHSLHAPVAKIIPQRPKAAPNKSHTWLIVLYRRTSCIRLPAASTSCRSSPAKIPNLYSPMCSALSHLMLPMQTPSPFHTLSSPGQRLLLSYAAVTSTERALCRVAWCSGRH